MQSGRAPLHEIMSASESLHAKEDKSFWNISSVVDRLIKVGADVNVVDKVSYREAPYYNN